MLYATAMSAFANQWSGFRFVLLSMIVVSEVLSLIVAVPLYFLLRRFRTLGLLECALSGVAITILLNLVTAIVSGGPGYSAADSGGPTIVDGHLTGHGIVNVMLGTAVQSVLGASIGLCFWVIAVRSKYRSGDKT